MRLDGASMNYQLDSVYMERFFSDKIVPMFSLNMLWSL